MNPRVVHTALCLGALVFAGCDQPSTDAGACTDDTCLAVEPDPPKFYVTPPFGLNFNCVMTGCNQVRPLTISNRGGNSVDIDRVVLTSETSADFVLESAGVLPTSIPTDETLTVQVRYQPQDALPDDGTVRIVYTLSPGTDENPDPMLLPLRTRTLGSPKVELPKDELNFEFVNPDEALTKTFVVQNLTAQNAILMVTNVEMENGSDAEFSVISGMPEIANAADEVSISIQFSPLLTTNATRTYLNVVHLATNDGANPDVTVHLVGTARETPELSFDPPLANNTLDLGSIGVENTLQTTLSLRNLGGTNLLMAPQLIDAADSNFTIEPSSEQLPTMSSFERNNLLVRFTAVNGSPARGPSDRRPMLHLQTNDPNQLQVDIQLNAFGILPHAQPSVDRVDFGDVIVEWQATPQTVLLRNTSTGPLNVAAVFLEPNSNAQFHLKNVVELPAVLMPDDQPIKVTLHYNPVTLGQATGALVFQTDDTDSPLTRVQITDRGISCEENCPIPHATPNCTLNSCSITSCEANQHNADEVQVNGCECGENDNGDLTSICGQDEKDFGRVPNDGSTRTFNGTLHDSSDTDILWIFMDDEDSASQLFDNNFDVEIKLKNTPGDVELCIRKTDHNVQGEGCGHGSEQCGVTRQTKGGSYGSDDDTNFTIKVRLTPNTAPFCANYTVHVKND